jgi:hypothetical protein
MRLPVHRFVLVVAVSLLGVSAPAASQQTSADSYTRYELQPPETQSFRIIYDVSATTAGASYYWNGIRRGSVPTVHGVIDLMTGEELEWDLVLGDVARRNGLARANADQEYIQVRLRRPVPAGGEARLRIDKTYRDSASYHDRGAEIVFSRSLGIRRNAVVLPVGYEVIGVSYPSQIVTEDDGRIRVSFMNPGPGGVSYEVRARSLPAAAPQVGPSAPPDDTPVPEPRSAPASSSGQAAAAARVDYTFAERAFQDREIVYFLQQPETHSFRLYHDYTETRAGMDRYLNVVRAGSKATNPSALMLDTGEKLQVETLRGREITERGIDIGRQPAADTEVVVIWFDPVQPGHSVRLRIEETYTDPNRYVLVGGELVWDRSFGRPRNSVVLPEGWYVTANSIPARVSQTTDGRIQLDYWNDRPGSIPVYVRAKRRLIGGGS